MGAAGPTPVSAARVGAPRAQQRVDEGAAEGGAQARELALRDGLVEEEDAHAPSSLRSVSADSTMLKASSRIGFFSDDGFVPSTEAMGVLVELLRALEALRPPTPLNLGATYAKAMAQRKQLASRGLLAAIDVLSNACPAVAPTSPSFVTRSVACPNRRLIRTGGTPPSASLGRVASSQ